MKRYYSLRYVLNVLFKGKYPEFFCEAFLLHKRTLDTSARPLWAYRYTMSFIVTCKGHSCVQLCITEKCMSFIKDMHFRN